MREVPHRPKQRDPSAGIYLFTTCGNLGVLAHRLRRARAHDAESGGKTTHGGVGHASNRWLKCILVEIVTTLKLAPGPVGTYYRHLLRAKGKPKATTAAARKFCCYLFWMLKEGWSYDEWLRQHAGSRGSEVRPMQRLGAMA
jgi:hypothetical protein